MGQILASWQIWAVLAAIFAALTAIFAKIGVENIDSDLATFVRTLVVITVLGGILWFRDKASQLNGIDFRTGSFLVLSGLATGASWVCYFRALKLGPASQVAPIDKLSVVLVAIFAAIFLGEHMSATGWLGVTLIAGGAILVAIAA